MDGGGSHRGLSRQSWPPPSTPMHEEEVLRKVARAGQSPGEAGVANCELCGFLAMPQYIHLSNGHKSSRGGWQGLHERIGVWGPARACLRDVHSQAVCRHCGHHLPRVREPCRVQTRAGQTCGCGARGCSGHVLTVAHAGCAGPIAPRLLGHRRPARACTQLLLSHHHFS